MTEKRYTHNILGSVFKDGKLFALTDGESQARTLCIELNELNDKNIELHIQNDFLKDENQHMRDLVNENEQLKQFKENVIKWVDSQMKFNAKKYIETEDCYFKCENIDLYNFKVFIGINSDD